MENSKNFWRIGVRYVDLAMFEKGFPYVHGEGVTDWGYLDYLKDIEPGDILVAGGIQRVSFIGEVTGQPVYLFTGENDSLYRGKGIKAAGPAITEVFAHLENDYSDVVCIPVKWFPLACASLLMPVQEHGGIRPLNSAGIAWVERLLETGKMDPEERVENMTAENPLLNFTAIDFETGSGYRNSVCQVGLVRVENGVIVETYSSLIQPPDNFIRADWTEDLHGISPEDTAHAPPFAESYPRWKHLVENKTLVAHNARFDMGCLAACLSEFCGSTANFDAYCTCDTWRGAFDSAALDACCTALGVTLVNHHNALADAEACARLFLLAQEQGRELKRYVPPSKEGK